MNVIAQDSHCGTLIIEKRNGHHLECFVDVSDLPRIIEFGKRWSADWSKRSRTYYVYCRDSEGKKIYLHRWLLSPLETFQIDHKNHNGLDNKRSNIRVVTQSVNNLNMRTPRNNTSGFRGVTWNARRSLWQAQVKVDRKCRNLGCFVTKEEANAVVSEYRKVALGCIE